MKIVTEQNATHMKVNIHCKRLITWLTIRPFVLQSYYLIYLILSQFILHLLQQNTNDKSINRKQHTANR